MDPIAGKYPWNSPYAFAENKPIEGVDLDGKELLHYAAVLQDGKITAIQLEGVQSTIPANFETILGTTITENIPVKRFGRFYVLQFGFYNYVFGSSREMFNAIAGANEYFEQKGMGNIHGLPNVPYNKTLEYGEEFGKSLQRLGNLAAAGVNIGAGIGGLRSLARDAKTLIKKGYSTSWSKMDVAERRAFQHSYSRHSQELGLPNWQQSKAEVLRGLFNEKVSSIREAGAKNFFQTTEWVNGAKTTVNRTEPIINGQKYFYYETLQGKFISAGTMP